MIKVKENLSNKTFGYLTVIKQGEDYISKSGNKQARWLCECVCGKKILVLQSLLKNGSQKSCGCKHFLACKKFNDYTIKNNTVYVILSNKKDAIMLCDLDDWEKLKIYCWSLNKLGYAEARVNGKTRLFHHFVIDCNNKLVRDHINRNKLDNRKTNIRIVSHSGNNINKSYKNKFGINGIYKNKNKYVARININKKQFYLGSYTTLEKAKEARIIAENNYFSNKEVMPTMSKKVIAVDF